MVSTLHAVVSAKESVTTVGFLGRHLGPAQEGPNKLMRGWMDGAGLLNRKHTSFGILRYPSA